ncbi:nucleotidyltransferase domain-containing protein [Sphingobacterium kitahiroshimense]|uniref:Nucleotidyltransferase family protein n=1 Tax=Sphingobacterium kitahiroshimense TaxID=470446 RepID=A0ABV0BW81_9SPHI
MTRIEGALLYLLQVGLWNKQGSESDFFPLSEKEWTAVLEAARKQTVAGIVYSGLQRLSAQSLPSHAIRIKCMVVMDRIERFNDRQIQQIAEQYTFFKERGLYPILLKGQGVAASYLSPDHRMCGDVDWCFEKSDQYASAQLLLCQMGASVATVHGEPVYQWKETEIDLHSSLFDVHNPLSKAILRRFRNSFPDTTVRIGDQDIVVLAPLLQVIQVTLHILKHSLSFGLGLRQFCDLACLYHQYGKSLDGEQLRQIYRKLGILRWITGVHQLLTAQLGLDPTHLPFPLEKDISSRFILDDIWSSGNFGFYDAKYTVAHNGRFSSRKDRPRQLFRRLLKYVKYAPMETLWFPITHFVGKHKD